MHLFAGEGAVSGFNFSALYRSSAGSEASSVCIAAGLECSSSTVAQSAEAAPEQLCSNPSLATVASSSY